MLIRGNKSLQQRVIYYFAKYQSYKLQQTNTVVDYRSLLYTPSKKLEFQESDQGKRTPLYLWNPKFYSYQLKYAKYNVAFFTVGYFLKNNPFYETFPAALPIMFCLEVLVIAQWLKLGKYFKSVVKEIWLHYGGETVEVVWAKQFTRKIQEQPTSEFLFTPNLQTPSQTDDIKPMSGHLFPTQYTETESIEQKQSFEQYSWAWTKYYYNPESFIIIPKNAAYIDMELLCAVFRGLIIQTTPENTEVTTEDLRIKFPLKGKN